MGLARILVLFALFLGVATVTAFLGYGYLGLASDYRARNFVHLSQVENALETARGAAVIYPDQAATLGESLGTARAQAVWCIENLSRVETGLFQRLGAGPALDICRKDIETADRALELLEEIRSPHSLTVRGNRSAFALRLQLIDILQEMKRESLAFQPHTEHIQTQLTRLVEIATVLTGLALGAIFLVLSRLLSQAWNGLRNQTADMARMSQRFSLAMDASGEGIALFDSHRRLISCNDRFRVLAHAKHSLIRNGMTPEQIMRGALAQGVYRINPRNGRNRDRAVSDHFDQLKSSPGGVLLELSKDRHVIEKLAQTAMGDILLTRTDITEFVRNERRQAEHAAKLEAASQEIEHNSQTDALTGLPNRRKLDLTLQQRSEQDDAPLIRIDLDRFKQVNDVLGHEAGDFVLCTVADILRRHTRAGDLPARIGGDEFVVACAPETTMAEAEAMAERLLGDILKPVRFGNKRCVYGASFGIAAASNSGSDAASVLRDADFALYRAKRGGRGRIEVFTDDMRRAAHRDRALADDFVEALSQGQIVPFFQTQHAARDGALTGVEVLARWRHPREGVLAPGLFLPIACQLGMEAELDETIFRGAVETLHRLDDEGLRLPSAAFNVSAARIADPAFVRQVTEVVTHEQHRITFEILESVSMESMGPVMSFAIDALKEAGFRIEVDDFGSGHASINSLLDIQPHALKIDRALIRPLSENERARQTVGAIIDMARSVNVEVVAEGVDSKDKAKILKEMGCDRLQGFLFSRPMSAADLSAFLRAQDAHPRRRADG